MPGTNEYDSLLQDASGSGNEYDALLSNQNSQLKQGVAGSMYVAADQNSENVARAARLAGRLKVPVDQIYRNYDDYKKIDATVGNDYDKLVTQAPGTAKFLTDPTNAGIAKDDFQKLQDMETSVHDHTALSSMYDALKGGIDAIGQIGPAVMDAISDPVGTAKAIGNYAVDAGKALATGSAKLGESAAGVPAYAAQLALTPENLVRKAMGKDQLVAPEWLRPNAHLSQSPSWQADGINDSTIDAIKEGNYAKAGRSLSLQLFNQAPALVSAALAGPAGPALFGLQTASDSNAETAEQGGDPTTGILASTAKGGIAAITQNAFGILPVLKNWEGAIEKTYGSQVASEVLKGVSKTLAYTVGGEGLAMAGQTGANDVLDYTAGLNPHALEGIGGRMLESGLMGATMGAVMSAPHLAGIAYSKAHDVRQAQLSKDFLTDLGKQATDTKTHSLMADKIAEHLNTVADGSPVENVYIPVQSFDTYFQGAKENPTKQAQDMGIAAAYDEAKKTGGDIQVPLGDYVAKLAGTPHFDGLANDVKFDPNKPSVKEAVASHSETVAQLAQVDQSAQQGEQERASSARAVQDDVKSQLQEVGFNATDSTRQAQLYGAFFDTAAQDTGLNAHDLYKEYGLKFRDMTQMTDMMAARGEGNTFNQSPLNPFSDLNGIKLGVSAAGDRLSVNPLNGAEASGSVVDAGRAGKTFVMDKFTTPEKYKGVGGDMIRALEKSAASRGADSILTSTKRLGIEANDPIVDQFKKAGYATREGDEGETILTKKVEKPKFYNQSGKETSELTPKEVKRLDVLTSKNSDSLTPKQAKELSDLQTKQTEHETAKQAYNQDEENPRGQIKFGTGETFIDLMKGKDLSTVLHESGHFFFEAMGKLASLDSASSDLKDNYKKLRDFAGLVDGQEVGVEHHETVARAFEAYLMEGKAPTKQLKKAFQTFKTWLTAVYRTMKGLNVELNPEIRSVFDRMLATDVQTTKAEKTMGYEPAFKDQKASGMSDEKWERYQSAVSEAREASENLVRKRLMDDVFKKQKAEYKEAYSATRDQVGAELRNSLDYKALDVLSGRNNEGPTAGMKLSKEDIERRYGKDAIKDLERGTTEAGGYPVDMAAEQLGYKDGDELMSSLRNKPKLEDAITTETESRMTKSHPDNLMDPQIDNKSIQDVHNDKRAAMLRFELEHMASNNMPALKDVIRRIARRLPTDQDVRSQAAEMVSNRQISDVKSHLYSRAEVKAAKEAGELLAKGDIDGAFDAKRRELLNHELYRAAESANSDIEKTVGDFKKLFKKNEDLAKSRDIDIVNAARAVLADHGITRSEKTADEYLRNLKQYDVETYTNLSGIIDQATQNATGDYKTMKYQDFVAMKDAVSALWDFAKSSREQTIDGVKVSRDQVISDLNNRLGELTKDKGPAEFTRTFTDREKNVMTLKGLVARARRVEHWAYAMDHGDINGVFTKNIYRPVKDAETRYELALKDASKAVNELVKDIPKEKPLKVSAPEIGHEFADKNELRAALLHTGNDSNLHKLLVGWGWGHILEDGTLDRSRWDSMIDRMSKDGTLKKEDFDFAQKVWDLNETFKADAQKAHKQVNGYYFNEVTANEFENQFGKYKGGYMPAVIDSLKSQDAMVRADKNALEGFNNSYMFPTTGSGFTKSRVESYAAPLDLKLSNIPSHINKVLKFTYMEPTIKEVARVVNDRSFRDALAGVNEVTAKEMLTPWLQRAAAQTISTPSSNRGFDKVCNTFRRRASLSFMAMNFANMIETAGNVFPMMVRIGPQHITGALMDFAKGPHTMAENIMEKSDFMKTKIGQDSREFTKDFDDLVFNPSKFQKFAEGAEGFARIGQRAMIHTMEKIAWAGAYRQALHDGLPEADAIRKADSESRQVMPDAKASSISSFEAGTPFMRLFTMFSQHFNTMANLLGTEYSIAKEMGFRTKDGSVRAAKAYAFVMMAPGLIAPIAHRIFGGQNLLDANDDGNYLDDFAQVFGMGQVKWATAMLPGGTIVNSLANQGAALASGKHSTQDDRISLSPALGVLETALRAPFEVYKYAHDGKREAKTVHDAMVSLGMITGLPAGLIGRPLEYRAEVEEGKARPTGPIDYARGLVTGHPGGRTK